MQWLAEHDLEKNRGLIQDKLGDENIDVANTAFLLLEKPEFPIESFETYETREISS